VQPLQPIFTERQHMLSWDAATCWRKLEEFGEQSKGKQYTNEVDLGHAQRIVEALARFGKESEEKVHALLSQKIEDYHDNPLAWLDPGVVRVAGQPHSDPTVPLLIAKLLEEGALLNEECAGALPLIGPPAVLEALAKAFPGAPHHFRLYSSEPLEHIHSDLA